MRQRDRSRLLVVVAVAVVGAVAMAGILFRGQTVADRQYLFEVVPAFAYLGESVAAGSIPAWWPGVGLGVPFASELSHAAYYPPAWFLAGASSAWGIDLFFALHLGIAALGVAALARRLGADPFSAVVGAGAFLVSGLSSSLVSSGHVLLGVSWVPWAIWAALGMAESIGARERAEWAAWLAAFAAAIVLAGVPVVAVIGATVAIALAAAAARAGARLVTVLAGAAALAAAAMLAAIAWLPPILSGGAVSAGISIETLGSASVVASVPEPAQASGDIIRHLHLGLPILALAVMWAVRGRWRERLAGGGVLFLGVVAVLLDTTWAEWQLALAAISAVFVCAAGGAGLRAVLSTPLSRAGLVGVAAAVAVLVGVELLRGASGQTLAVVLIGNVGFVIALALSRPSSKLAPALAVALLLGGAAWQSWGTLPLVERAAVAETPALLADAGEGPFRGERLYRPAHLPGPGRRAARAPLVWASDSLDANVATRSGLAYLRGRHPRLAPELTELWRRSGGASERLMDLFAVRYAVVPASVAIPAGMPVRAELEGRLALVENEHRRPRAFVTPSWRRYDSSAELVDDLFPPARELRRGAGLATVRLIGEGSDSAPAPGPVVAPPCDIVSEEATRVVIECDAPERGYAVLLDRFEPEWRATIDGDEATIERADLLARAVPVEAGLHRIEFRYEAVGRTAAAAVSMAAAFLLVSLLLFLSYLSGRGGEWRTEGEEQVSQ